MLPSPIALLHCPPPPLATDLPTCSLLLPTLLSLYAKSILLNIFIAIMTSHYDDAKEKYGQSWFNRKLFRALRAKVKPIIEPCMCCGPKKKDDLSRKNSEDDILDDMGLFGGARSKDDAPSGPTVYGEVVHAGALTQLLEPVITEANSRIQDRLVVLGKLSHEMISLDRRILTVETMHRQRQTRVRAMSRQGSHAVLSAAASALERKQKVS